MASSVGFNRSDDRSNGLLFRNDFHIFNLLSYHFLLGICIYAILPHSKVQARRNISQHKSSTLRLYLKHFTNLDFFGIIYEIQGGALHAGSLFR